MKTSLKDIAEALRLSKTTVSWVLAGKGNERGISQATQTKVYKYAEKLDYQPNLLARSLNTGKSETIGLIIPDITDSFYSKVACAIEREVERRGYSLMIGNSESKVEQENKMIRLFEAKQVDGIIIAPTKISKTGIQHLINRSFPVVLFDRYFSDMKTSYVVIDNEESSYKLVRNMICNGAKKIAILTTNPHLRTMNMRREGYARALMESNIPVDSDLYGEVLFVNYEENIYKTLDQIFSRVPDVDGFFFTTHILALESFRYFYEKGIDINKGFELACIHSVSAFRVLAPKMNIAQMPIDKIGENTVRILFDSIKNQIENKEDNIETLILECEISKP